MRNFINLIISYFKYPLRLITTAVQSFLDDDCYTKASTLTFYTLQSLIPLLAFAIAIAKGFGFEEYLEEQITQTFQEQREVLSYAIFFAHSMLQQIAGSVIIGFGVLLLLWTSLNLLGYIEVSFNSIWKIKTPRTLYQKFKDFLVILVICPIVFVTSSALTVYFRESVSSLQNYAYLETISSYLLLVFKLSPLFLSFLLFLILYLLIPNSQIKFAPRVFAAMLAGAAFQAWQFIFIEFQVKIFNYNVVYGTFAIIPLFLIWLQFSWLIVLMGAEIAASIENKSFINVFIPTDRQRMANKKQLGLLVLYKCLQRFYENKEPLTTWAISQRLKIPINLTQHLLDILEKNHVLTSLPNAQGQTCYLPLSDPEQFTIKEVANFFDESLENNTEIETSEPLTRITDVLHRIADEEAHSTNNISLKELCCAKP